MGPAKTLAPDPHFNSRIQYVFKRTVLWCTKLILELQGYNINSFGIVACQKWVTGFSWSEFTKKKEEIFKRRFYYEDGLQTQK